MASFKDFLAASSVPVLKTHLRGNYTSPRLSPRDRIVLLLRHHPPRVPHHHKQLVAALLEDETTRNARCSPPCSWEAPNLQWPL